MPRTHMPDPVRRGILWLPISFMTTWLGCSIYIQPIALRTTTATAAAFCFMWVLQRQQAIRRKAIAREQFKWFLELLLSRLSAGATLERALCDTIPGMEQMLSTKSPFLKALHSLDHQLKASQSLNQSLMSLADQVSCPEVRYFFRLLPELQRTGSQIIPFARHYLHMVAEQLALQQTISSDTTQRRTEAIFLAVMPFAMAALIRSSLDVQTAHIMSGPIGIAGMTMIGMVALTALILVCRMIIFDPDPVHRAGRLSISKKKPGRLRHWLAARLAVFYRTALPAVYNARLLKMLFSLERQHWTDADDKKQALVAAYFLRKLDLTLLTLIPSMLCGLAVSGGYYFFFLPAIIFFLHDRLLLNRHRQQLADYQVFYPILINMLTALLQAGLSLHRAFLITADCLQTVQDHKKGESGSLVAELGIQQNKIRSGSPVSMILQDMMTACPLPEAQAALLLLLRYEQAGEDETIQLLTLQSNACWSLHRNAARRQLEQQGLKLLLPMTLDLIAVLMTAMLPAVLSLYVF